MSWLPLYCCRHGSRIKRLLIYLVRERLTGLELNLLLIQLRQSSRIQSRRSVVQRYFPHKLSEYSLQDCICLLCFIARASIVSQWLPASRAPRESELLRELFDQHTVWSILMADMPCREIPCRLITTGHIRYLKWFPLYFPPSQRYLQPHRHVVMSFDQHTVWSILMADMPCREIPCRLITTGHIRYLKWFPLYFPPSQRYLQPHRHVVTSSIVKRRFKIFSKSHFLSPTTKGNRRGGGEGGGHKNLHWSHCWLNWRAPWEKWKQIHTLESERAETESYRDYKGTCLCLITVPYYHNNSNNKTQSKTHPWE